MLTTILFIILIILLYLLIKEKPIIQESFVQKKIDKQQTPNKIIIKEPLKNDEKIEFKNNFKHKSKKSNYKKWIQHTESSKKKDCTECKNL